jgi:tetratricopeptide (TPR) repeat protein
MSLRAARLAVVVLALAVAGAACGRYSINNIRSLKAFQDANKLYMKTDYPAAIERYKDAINLNPDLGFAYFFLGNSYDQMYKPSRKGEPENDKNLIEATKQYELAIAKLANATSEKEVECRKRAFEYLINAYGADKLNQFDKAEPIAKQLIDSDPSDPSNYQLLGRLYEDVGRYEEAEAHYRKAVEIRPNEGLGYMVLAGYYNRRGENPKMMQAWHDRAKVEPNNPEAFHTIASYYWDWVFKDKRLSRADALANVMKGLSAEDEALKLNPDYFEAASYKNLLLRQQALYERDPARRKELIDEAEVWYKKAIDIQKKQNTGADAGKSGKKGK